MKDKKRATCNRTITLNEDELEALRCKITKESSLNSETDYTNTIINADMNKALKYIPDNFADLVIIDPPYNLTKNFNGYVLNAESEEEYEAYIDSILDSIYKKLKPNGSLYVCGDWKCTASLQRAISKKFTIINRITWQREKGRGAKHNWKNSMEDIWFAVKDENNYYFDVDAVKIKRRVIAPYKDNGQPKDWRAEEDGNFRLTHPSNFWDDITVPFWSMPENTDHPTQKSEKLYAKLILASSKEEDVILDPFLGSGTTCVAAKKLNRKYCGIEMNEEYCLLAQKRLDRAETDKTIQGYSDGIFWERNAKK